MRMKSMVITCAIIGFLFWGGLVAMMTYPVAREYPADGWLSLVLTMSLCGGLIGGLFSAVTAYLAIRLLNRWVYSQPTNPSLPTR